MKKALLALAAVAIASSSYAQGIITFYNNGIPVGGHTVTSPGVVSATDPTVYRAGIFRPGPTPGTPGPGAGAGFTAGLFLASNLDTPLAVTTFRLNNTFEVFVTSQDVVVPGVAVGQTANFVVRAWETGSTFAQSQAGGTWGEAAFTSGPLGGAVAGQPPAANATMSGFNGIIMTTIPEPSSLALGVIGIGAMMLRRRK